MAGSKVVDAYTKWLDDSGVFRPKVGIKFIDDVRGYGLFAKENIACNEVVMKIPESIVLDAESIRKNAFYGDLLKQGARLKPNEELTLFVARERNNLKSRYSPYFNMIFNRGKLIPLLTYTKEDIGDLPVVMQPLWTVEQCVVEESFTSINALCPEVQKHEFLDAFNAVFTRSYKSRDKTCLIPLADMVNHSNDPNTYQFRLQRANPQLYVIMSNRTIAKDAEITFSYGEFENSLLWLLYGFHLQRNPFDRSGIPWPVLVDCMLKERFIARSVVEFLDKTAFHGNNITPVVYADANGKLSTGFRGNIETLLTIENSLSGTPAESFIVFDQKVNDVVKKVLQRLRKFIDGKSLTLSEDKKLMWIYDLKCIEAAIKQLELSC